MEEQLKEVLGTLTASPVQWNCALAPFTSFGIGGPAEAVVVVESSKELGNLLSFFADHELPWRLIGKGSNLLVSDEGFAGVVMLLGKRLSEIVQVNSVESGGVHIRVGAGCSLARLLKWCLDKGYSGIEFVAGIPGSLGGAVVMNAGTQEGEMAAVIQSMTVLSVSNGEEQLQRDELDFSYRSWNNQRSEFDKRLVLSVDMCLRCGDKGEIQSRCRGYIQQRKEKQPTIHKNAGSFFKNPPGDSAGRLIEASGLKGVRCGGAMVSPVHANFLVNTGTATAEEVEQLMRVVMDKVKGDSGIQLQPEVHFL